MATPEKTTRQFGAEAQARRDRRAAKAARLREVALDSLDVGRARPVPGGSADPVEAGVSEALATTNERAALRAARGGRAVQEAQRNLAVKKAEVRQGPAAGKQASSERPRLRDRLEAMSESERLDVVESMRPGPERDYVAGLVASIAEVEEEVDYEHARWLEEQQLAAYEDEEPSTYWPDSGELTESERRAEADLAAETAGPLYTGGDEEVYSDDVEGWYEAGFEEEEGGDE
jgi:hypothetical protein